ncbi:MAG: hypothetical protein P4L80_12080 [Xanthobacteraceae bacterium]|nr:hypothetical protein [Xanthobacteraceae bacterium]
MTEFEQSVVDRLEEIRDDLETIVANQAAHSADLADLGNTLLDAINGAPEGHHALLAFVAHDLAPYWRGEPPRWRGATAADRRRSADDEAQTEVLGVRSSPPFEIKVIDVDPDDAAPATEENIVAQAIAAGMAAEAARIDAERQAR